MPEKFFQIYRASAGSGKTFTLAREYLKLALRHPDGYRHILGVTFTNKATAEMKHRIVDTLRRLADGERHDMAGELKEALGTDDEGLQQRAKATLARILHQYGRFAVVTIDSFFHQVIRSFAREMGLHGSFSIELDTPQVINEVIDDLLASLGQDDKKQLRSWLSQFAGEKVEEGKPWDFRSDIAGLAMELLNDEFKPHAASVWELNEDPDFFPTFKKELGRIRATFEKKVEKMAGEAVSLIEQVGIAQFKSSANGPAGLFRNMAKGNYDISPTRRAADGDVSKWLTKKLLDDPMLRPLVENELLPRYRELLHYVDQNLTEYTSAVAVQKYFYTFGILAGLHEHLVRYRDENEVMLIADLSDFLRQIIRGSDTPYIYEKVGSLFQHYLIDEFQDTSGYQWDNFSALVKNGTDQGYRSMVVGDVKQSIYRWRGGDWQLLQQQVAQDIGTHTTEEKTLGVNFRSSEKIVGFNNWMFGQVSDMVGRYFAEIGSQFQPLIDQVVASYSDVAQLYAPGGHTGGYVSLQFIESDESWQEEAIARTIAAVEQAQLTGFSLRDIAILVHTKAEGKRIANAFMRYKGSELARSDLRYEVVSSEALFLWASYTVKFVISLIRWLHQEEDSISLTEWMYLYQRYIRKNDRTDDTIFQSRKSWTKQVPSGFVSQKDYLKTLPLFELVESLIYHFELNDNPEEYAYLQGFQDAILDYSKNGRNDIASFLTWWESTGRNRAIQVPDENDAIKILTVHKAKGLEYPVVILPFLSWALDHHSSNERILWVNGPDLPPYQQLPVIPLKYGSDLANTYWSDAYWKEKISVFLDKLNLLYVAFTRPVQALYVFSKLPKNGKISDMGQLVFQQAQLHEGWNEAACQLEIGQGAPAPGKSQRAVSEYALTRYECGRWRGKISLQMKGALEGSGEVFDARQWGVELHRDLGRLKRMEDLYLLKDVNLKRELKLIVRHEAIEPFFADIDDVKVEEPILLPNGESRRIDRLVKKNGDWIVVDFKTGVPRGKDHHQVREYMKILQTMGYGKPKGYLVYLDPVEVVKVD